MNHQQENELIDALQFTVLNTFEPVTTVEVSEMARDDYDTELTSDACAAFAVRINAYGLGSIVANFYETDYTQNLSWIREDNGLDRNDNSRDAELIELKRSNDIAGYMKAFADLAPMA